MNDPFAAIAQPGAAPNPSAWSASYDPAKDPNAAGLPQPVGPVRGDPFAAIAQATPPPALPVSVQLHDLSANPRGEGTYKMQGKDGTPLQVPYSNVQHAMKTGYDMAGAGERARFSEDYMADPSTTHGVIERLTSLPMDMNVGAAKALLRSVGNLAAMALRDPSVGLPEGAIDAIEKSAPVRAASDFANQPNKNVGQTAGDVGENVAEYFAGDELLKMAGSFKGAETLQKMMTERPVLGKLLRIGLNTAKQATIGGGQTYVHTGGDVGATAESAGINAAVTAGLGAFGEGSRALIEGQMPEVRTVEGTRIPVPKGQAGPTPAQVAGAEAYGKAAGATVAPHLAAMGAPPEFIENTLNSVHDFTGAADRLRDVNRNAYEFLDQATSGRFRKLNAEISQAQQASWDGVEGADRLYTQKTREMEDLLGKVQSGKPDVTVNRPAAPGTDLMKQGSMARPGEPARTGGTQKVSPGMSAEDLAAIKTSWRQYYILRDAGRTLDGALDGVPGASAVSQEQRGINGGRLMSGLKKMVNRYGRATVEQSMGPGRLANLEAIANATRTNICPATWALVSAGRQAGPPGPRWVASPASAWVR
jgi:hypothetical protein